MGPRRTLLVVVTAITLAATTLPAAAVAASPIPTSYPRSETLYTSGTLWGPPGDFNPLNQGDYTTGTLGLLYEPLFLYNPLTDKFIPWLAQSGSWTGTNTYTVKLRQGIKWTDGTSLTADDVHLHHQPREASLGSVQHNLELPEECDQGRPVHRHVHVLQDRIPGVGLVPVQLLNRAGLLGNEGCDLGSLQQPRSGR